MRAMLLREIRILARTPALAAAVGVHVLLLTGFLSLWGGGVPLLPGDNLYQQQRLVQWGLLAALLPWVASRCGADERGDALVLLSGLTAVAPSRIVAARIVARAVACALVVLSGLPLMVLAEQMSAVEGIWPFVDLLPALALGLLAAVVAVCWSSVNLDVVLAWAGATLTILAIVAASARGALQFSNAALLGGIAIVAAAACAARADAANRFLSESRG